MPRCKDCGEEFTIGKQAREFFTRRGLELPKRCADCRARRRAQACGEAPAVRLQAPQWDAPRRG